MSHTPGPWIMKPGDPKIREGWSIEALNSPHPLGSEYTREDNVVGKCCSAGVYREEDARLICAAPDLLEALKIAKAELEICAERNWHGVDSDGKNYRTICAAIAKAEGTAQLKENEQKKES